MLKGSSGSGCPSLHCLQGCRDRHFFTFPFSTSSLRPDATRERLAGALGLQLAGAGCLGGSALPGVHPFSPGDGALHKSCREGRHERADRQRASADLLLLDMSLTAGDPHAADLENTSTAWCRWPELALPDLLLLKPAAPFLARLRGVLVQTQVSSENMSQGLTSVSDIQSAVESRPISLNPTPAPPTHTPAWAPNHPIWLCCLKLDFTLFKMSDLPLAGEGRLHQEAGPYLQSAWASSTVLWPRCCSGD